MKIPRTRGGLDPFECISALQKFCRRGQEKPAMEIAIELAHSSKTFLSMVCKRLRVIALEDVDCVAQPHIVPFIDTVTRQAIEWHDPDPAKAGKVRLCLANAIMMLCRARKSRIADHLGAAVGWRSIIEGFTPEIPTWTRDQHTREGRRLGRGLDYFRDVSTQLVPPPAEKDPYQDEAYRQWAARDARKAAPAPDQPSLQLDDQ